MIQLLLFFYSLAWRLALPLLKRKNRTSFGWEERIVKDVTPGPFDLWIQAASGGEAMLTNMIIEQLGCFDNDKKVRILVTAGTKEGVDSLLGGAAKVNDKNLDVHVRYFPFDAPFLMEKAIKIFAPRLIVILETELWPAFLISAKRHSIPVYLFNGRMSDKSAGTYEKFHKFFHSYGPDRVWAISELDRRRFSRVVGAHRVETMVNIKFDRITAVSDTPPDPALRSLLAPGKPFLLLGSIRREEEDQILFTITKLLAARNDIIIGLFPKHIDRADFWQKQLSSAGMKAVKRSEIEGAIPTENVIIWDVFGELAAAYNLAQTTFVGGSLVKLGGQNFLEPLVFGLRPIIGPSWRNFGWVGQEIMDQDLVTIVDDKESLVTTLLERLDEPLDRATILDKVRQYFDPKKGGTRFVCLKIQEKLEQLDNL